MLTRSDVPASVQHIADTLEAAGYEAYLVGGCVRDLLLSRTPKDWDITTSAHPSDITALFPETYCNNDYGTVGVVTDAADERVKVVEVTPFRRESAYSDARRPDEVVFGVSLEDDLLRRDFTVNAIAFRLATETLVDCFGGQKDMQRKRLAAVGEARERLKEDALRMMRAVRLAVELSFTIESETVAAIAENAEMLARISKERVRDEFVRIIGSDEPMQGVMLLEKLGLLRHVVPELLDAIGVEQNQAHKYDVYEHLLRTMQHAADMNWSQRVRIAALFHDISKPATRRFSREKRDWTFHGHEVVGARVTKKALQRLAFSKECIDEVTTLVRWHMFFSDPEKVTLAAVRRTIKNVGTDRIEDLLNLRVCDRIGSGRPKAQPFRLRKYMAMVDEALHDPLSVAMLHINGTDIMELSGEKPGKKLGYTLHALLEEVLDDPTKNTKEYLFRRAMELMTLSEEQLARRGASAKTKVAKEEARIITAFKRKHRVDESMR